MYSVVGSDCRAVYTLNTVKNRNQLVISGDKYLQVIPMRYLKETRLKPQSVW